MSNNGKKKIVKVAEGLYVEAIQLEEQTEPQNMSDSEEKECEFDCVAGGYCYLGYVKLIPEFEDLCADNPNCYYKQLQAAKQENALMKEGLEKAIGIIKSFLVSLDCPVDGGEE